ncbi:MAG TPA: hypothetical protein VFT56_00775 [Sphingomonas sp.]|nr:hypothetical protein [Sphingomonas sp.]
MNLLLLLYAMIAGLTGFNAGPAAIARTAAVAEQGAVAEEARVVADPARVVADAIAARAASAAPIARLPDQRRVAVAALARPTLVAGRAAPERRLE